MAPQRNGDEDRCRLNHWQEREKQSLAFSQRSHTEATQSDDRPRSPRGRNGEKRIQRGILGAASQRSDAAEHQPEAGYGEQQRSGRNCDQPCDSGAGFAFWFSGGAQGQPEADGEEKTDEAGLRIQCLRSI